MSDFDAREAGKSVASAFQRSVADWHALTNLAHEETRWNILNSFVYALNGENLRFLSGHVSDPEKPVLKVVGFTDGHVIYFEGTAEKSGPVWSLFKRTGLKMIDVVTAPQILTLPSYEFAENKTKLRLTYGNGHQFELPLARNAAPIDEEFADTLRADLTSL